jgi:hypothetical protein
MYADNHGPSSFPAGPAYSAAYLDSLRGNISLYHPNNAGRVTSPHYLDHHLEREFLDTHGFHPRLSHMASAIEARAWTGYIEGSRTTSEDSDSNSESDSDVIIDLT